jgi:acetyl-CoA carboxylase carboxyl transferase subunit alpha
MNPDYLEFEQPIADLISKIEELRLVGHRNDLNISGEIEKLSSQATKLTEQVYGKLTSWQVSQVARHPRRPYTLDYIERIFSDFDELHGDRHYADDAAIVGGMARLNGHPIMIIGPQKGREVAENVRRHFAMPRPEGYRKALRLMQMAERFNMPVITFINTMGAYPGIGAEERGQSEAIAYNLLKMSSLKVPVICTVIGEGGSGGALAIGVGDQVNMLQYSTYSVISPEGCASILWKTAERASDAAEAMGITAPRLKDLGLIDHIISEPLGGAHRDYDQMAQSLKEALESQLATLKEQPIEQLLERRYERLMAYGI